MLTPHDSHALQEGTRVAKSSEKLSLSKSMKLREPASLLSKANDSLLSTVKAAKEKFDALGRVSEVKANISQIGEESRKFLDAVIASFKSTIARSEAENGAEDTKVHYEEILKYYSE